MNSENRIVQNKESVNNFRSQIISIFIPNFVCAQHFLFLFSFHSQNNFYFSFLFQWTELNSLISIPISIKGTRRV